MIKGDYRFKTCQCEGCLKQFIVDNHMNKSIGKGRHEWEKACVERGL
jgi:invasion protein IalB